MKVDIIIILIGVIAIGFFTIKQYNYMSECSRILGKETYDKKICDRILYGKDDKEDWEQYKRDVERGKFNHDLIEEIERMQREGR